MIFSRFLRFLTLDGNLIGDIGEAVASELFGLQLSRETGQESMGMLPMTEATLHRNKLFHGQLTDSSLGTEQLLSMAHDIRTWC